MLKRQSQGCFNGSLGVLGGGIGGALSPGVYPCNAAGVRTYFGSAGNYTGITETASYTIYWFEVLSDLSVTAVQNTGPNALSLGENTPILITGVDNSANVTMFLADAFTITTTPDAFSFLLDQELAALVSGDVWSQVLPSSAVVRSAFQLQYMGGQDTLEGDYGIYYQFTDPNGTTFYSTDNSQTFKWAPRVVIVAVDGNYNMRDALPDIAKSSVNVRYIVGLEVLTEDNEPVYDVDGKVIYFGDVSDEVQVAYALTEGINSIQITDVADDFGNLKDSDIKTIIATIPEILPYSPKVWDYTTDEFRLDAESTSLTELNGNPTGTATLTHRVPPTFVDYSEDIYHTVTNLAQFQNSSPLMRIALQVVEAPYLQNNNTIFKPETTWGFSGFFKYSGTSFYLCGREGATWGNGTSILVTGGGITIKVGGTQRSTNLIYGSANWNHIFWQNYYNGSAWVDDLYLNGDVVYTNRTTERGVNTSNVLPLFGGGWTIDTNIDPDIDSQSLVGGNLSSIRLAEAKLSLREINGLLYRNYKVMLDLKNGDSITTGYDGNPSWWELWRDNAYTKNLKVECPNIAISAQTFYNAMPVSPEAGFLAKGNWVTGGRPTPHPTQSCEYMYETFNPDVVTVSFTQNHVFYDYTEKNTSGTGSTGIPSTLGYNGYADEFLYGHKSIESWLTARNINFFWGAHVPNNSTAIKTVDNIAMKDVLRSCADDLLADSANLTNVYHFHYLLRETDNTWVASLEQGDGIHPNTAGMAIMYTPIEDLTFQRYIETREQNYIPRITYLDPIEGGTVFTSPYDIIHAHDGTEVTTTTSLTEGGNTINNEWTNSYGFIGYGSVTFTYAIPPLYNPYAQYIMDAITSSEFTDTSVNMINAPIQGTETISGSRWLCSAVDSMHLPNVNMSNGHALNDEFTHSIWIEKTNDTGVQNLCGLLPNTFSIIFGCYCNGTNIEFVIGGTYSGLISGINIAKGRTHLAWQNRDSGGGVYVVDIYVDGSFSVSLSTRGTNTTTIDAMVGAKSTSNTLATASPTAGFNGYIDNYQFFKRALSSTEILDIYTAEL